jgi:hypothetical protein
MKTLLEVEYKDIFSPETMASLKGKSGESMRQMLGNKTLNQTLVRSQELLDDIIKAEDEYRDELDMLAVQMVKDAYPIIDYADIKIDAKIVDPSQIDIQMGGGEDPSDIDFGADDPEKLKAKRRIINGITQGASVRGAFWFLIFREYLDSINPELVDKYNEIMKLVFGIYDDENAIAMMLAMLAQGRKQEGGESDIEYDENTEQFVIKARALCFPMLVHEIVKGLYEIIGTEGFGMDKSKNQAIINQIDKLSNEPRDLQYGKFIFDTLNNLYKNSRIKDDRVRELFFAEVYKLNDNEFIPFIENAVNDKLTSQQKQWATNTMRDIESDLKKDDTGLTDLDEVSIKKAIGTAALAAGLAGSPSTANAQNFKGLKDKFKQGITAVQNKLKPQQKVDTIYIKKDAPLQLQKYKNDKEVGYGVAEHINENSARQISYFNASVDLMKKLGKTQMTAGIEIVDEKMYQLPNGTYQAETIVKINK